VETKINTVIPRDRIGALIGPEGTVKNRIERAFNIRMTVNSESGVIELVPNEDNNDPVSLLKAKDVVTAIGKGFAPEKAFILFDDDKVLDVLDLRDLFGRSETDIQRVKGRIIGREGKMRRMIEEMTDASISVYGHTIGMIGGYDAVYTAREAVEMLIKGKQHATVYKFLRIKRREAKKKMTLELWEKPPG